MEVFCIFGGIAFGIKRIKVARLCALLVYFGLFGVFLRVFFWDFGERIVFDKCLWFRMVLDCVCFLCVFGKFVEKGLTGLGK